MIRFLRHCESTHNAGDSRDKDCELSERGKSQAAKLVGHFDIVICSPMRRCLDTLKLSSITYSKLIVSQLCREHRTDKCDFLANEDETQIESETCILERVAEFKRFLKGMVDENCDASICVVTHADFIFFLSSEQRGGELFGKWVENGEFIELDLV